MSSGSKGAPRDDLGERFLADCDKRMREAIMANEDARLAMLAGVEFEYSLDKLPDGNYALTAKTRNPVAVVRMPDGSVNVYETAPCQS